MGHVTIPNRPTPTQSRDINAILTNFDTITTVINGNLDSTNIAESGLTALNVQPGAFLELVVKGTRRKISYGSTTTGSFDGVAGRSSWHGTINHELGAGPQIYWGTAIPLSITENGGTPAMAVAVSIRGSGEPTKSFEAFLTVNGTSTGFTTLYWAVIG